MDAERARGVVRETFERGFDRARFEFFLRELLNRFDSKPLRYQGAYIPDAFKDHVALLDRIGTYSTSDGEKIDLLEVRLTKGSTLSRARTALRNYVAHHLKKRGGKEAALVAFVSPAEKTWRFSFVRMEYSTTTDERGRVGTITELTPARRLSYLVGEGESCHTAQSRFVDLLQRTGHDPTIEEIEEAFSVEAVTREFFERYRDLFLGIKEELDRLLSTDRGLAREFDAKRIKTVDFAKKLLGQVVFLYFLQKKGWLGVAKGQPWGTGPQNFLRRLARGEYGATGSFFNDVLEPLFYDTLATDRGHEAWCSRFGCRIPFLNGGLFEPLGDYDWRATDVAIPDSVFINEVRTPDGDVGTGILDVFDRYNFTVNEAEPLEKDVAIDPEMLGKVFENLLEVRERKSKGSFYTPREIVHYMCQASLINYLDQALNPRQEPVVSEPAVQVGLFSGLAPRQASLTTAPPRLVPREDIATFITSGEQASHYEAARKDGAKSYAHRLPKSIESNARRIDDALRTITVCDPAIGSGAFPVGMMTEIVRARMTLTPYFNDVAERTPYHFKRHAIQASLYGVDIDPGAVEIAKLRLWLSLVVDEDDVRQIKPLPNLDYKVVAADSLLGLPFWTQGAEEIERLKERYFDLTDHEAKERLRGAIDRRIQETLAGLDRSIGYHIAFDFRLFFSEVFSRGSAGFDIVIANPPYVSAWSMDKAARRILESRFNRHNVLKSHWDLYVAFVLLGHEILSPKGTLAYILPNPVLREKYACPLRRLILEQMSLESLLTFDETNVFESVSRKTVVLIAGNDAESSGRPALYRYVAWGREGGFVRFDHALDTSVWRGDPEYQFRVDADQAEEALKEKIEAQSARLGNYFYVNYGAQLASKDQGVFRKRDLLSSTPKGNAKSFYDGKDLQRWSISWHSRYVDYRKNRLYGPRTEALFEVDKIAIRNITDTGHVIAGTLDATGMYCDHTVVLAVPYSAVEGTELREAFEGFERSQDNISIEYVAGLLFSSLMTFYYRTKNSNESLQQATSHIFPKAIRALPIKVATRAQQATIASVVRGILKVAKAQDGKEVETLQQDLDEKVFALYQLTSKERQLILKKLKSADSSVETA